MTKSLRQMRLERAHDGLKDLTDAATRVLLTPDDPQLIAEIGALRDRVHGTVLCAGSAVRLNPAAWPMLQQAAEKVIVTREADRRHWQAVVDKLLEIATLDLRILARALRP